MPLLASAAVIHCLLARFTLDAVPAALGLSTATADQAGDILAQMKAAYAQVESYQTTTEVTVYRAGRVTETQRFLYTFEKPDKIRIAFETPHSGMVLTYPDKDGKVKVKPGGWTGFLRFHFSPDSSVFKSASGQRIDQTHMGLLIENIVHSLTDRRRGEIGLTMRDGQIFIAVLADDHFLPGLQTLYRFTIDPARYLPVSISELTPEGVPKRDVTFRDLKILAGRSDGAEPNGAGGPSDGRFE
jgi:outer membrane lipoprotein-sorting protein